jgi:hypothetical protein
MARSFPNLGDYIAEMGLEEGDPVDYVRTRRTPGHYTLTGEPSELLSRVVSVVRV